MIDRFTLSEVMRFARFILVNLLSCYLIGGNYSTNPTLDGISSVTSELRINLSPINHFLYLVF